MSLPAAAGLPNGGRACILLALLGLAGFLSVARAEEEAAGEAAGAELFDPEPEVTVPLGEPVEMIDAEPKRYRMMLRTSLWLPWADTTFRLGDAGTGTPFSMEKKFGAAVPVTASVPLEGYIRTENQEFRLQYVWWRYRYTKDPITMTFGGANFTDDEVTATLTTQCVGLGFLQRILDSKKIELYLTAGADLFVTSLELAGVTDGSDKLEETILLLPVGLGLRFNVREDVSVFVSHSALSYAQVFGVKEDFFKMSDVYRNVELSLVWEKAEWLDLGAGWRYHNTSFGGSGDRLQADQVMSGVSCWARFKF